MKNTFMQCLKRSIDFVCALLLLILLMPLMLAIALAIRLNMGRPVLFRQVRAGYKGRPFIMYKFRTMNNARDSSGRLLPDEQRLTRLGSFLRKWSLDELPELFNVLKGDMSLVGPRPLYVEYMPYYTKEELCRLDVRPGITGWAQVNGRNAISWDQKLALDVWYVKNWSLWLDFKILFLTLLKVIKKEGINAPGYATAPPLYEVRNKSTN